MNLTTRKVFELPTVRWPNNFEPDVRESIEKVLARTSLPLLLGQCSIEEWRAAVEQEFRGFLPGWRMCYDKKTVSKVLAEMGLSHLDFP